MFVVLMIGRAPKRRDVIDACACAFNAFDGDRHGYYATIRAFIDSPSIALSQVRPPRERPLGRAALRRNE